MNLLRLCIAVARWWGMLTRLIAADIGLRYRRSRWASVLAVVEPLAVVATFSCAGALMNKLPAYGNSVVLFYTSGVIPFYLFLHISLKFRNMDLFTLYPVGTTFDVYLAHFLAEVLIKFAILAIIFTGLWWDGVEEAIPSDPLGCILALFGIGSLGLAVGILNGIASSFSMTWAYTYPILVRGAMMVSAVLFVMDFLPPVIRQWAVMSPIAHGITWFRADVYHAYPVLTLNIPYFIGCTIALLALAILIEDATRGVRRPN